MEPILQVAIRAMVLCVTAALAADVSVAQRSSVVVSSSRYGFGPRHWSNGIHRHTFSTTQIWGAPVVYEYPWTYGVGYPYYYANAWPYYIDTGSGPLGPYVAPPLYVPPEQLGFGPQAVRQFMGIDPAVRPVINENLLVAPPADANNGNIGAPPNANGQENNAPKAGIRESNAAARDRARQFLEFGDTQFAARNVAEAYDRYKKAVAAAPDLAEPQFRLGQTLADMARYDQAAAAFRRGLSLEPEWPARGPRLQELYGGNEAGRASTLEKVRLAAAARPDDPNVQFVAGVEFFFDGQPDRARQYLERAKDIGEAAASVTPFLRLLGDRQQGDEQPQPELDI